MIGGAWLQRRPLSIVTILESSSKIRPPGLATLRQPGADGLAWGELPRVPGLRFVFGCSSLSAWERESRDILSGNGSVSPAASRASKALLPPV
jgi:hypothetical protein